jgi:hypothetical protein
MQSDLEKDFQELVLARLQTLPQNTSLSIGSVGEFSKQQLLEHVQANDEIGKKIIDVDKDYLKALKEGTLLA